MPTLLDHRNKILLAGLILIAFGGVVLLIDRFVVATPKEETLQTAEPVQLKDMEIEIASTTEARVTGLSGRASLSKNFGMLFIFEEKGNQSFWMKEMLVSIDIIWLDENGTILKIDANVLPETYPALFHSPKPLKYVLETNAGFAKESGWQAGVVLDLSRYSSYKQ